MKALSKTGKEGTLRARYVEQLAASEKHLRALDAQEAEVKKEVDRLKARIQDKLEQAGR